MYLSGYKVSPIIFDTKHNEEMPMWELNQILFTYKLILILSKM
jgi:hypothetical protein